MMKGHYLDRTWHDFQVRDYGHSELHGKATFGIEVF